MAEQRQELRANVEVEVHYRTLQEFIAAYSRNISGGGVFIRTPQPQPLNREVLLRFTLPGIARRFEVRGMVVWVNTASRSSFPVGMGIKFLQMDPKDVTLLADFMSKATKREAPPAKPAEEKKA